MTAPKHQLVADLWDNYITSVYDGPVPPQQLIETRRAFYGGCVACLALMGAGPARLMMNIVQSELDAFRDDVVEGRK